MSASPPAAVTGLAALEEITAAVEAGSGLPEVLRAASRSLDASLVLLDRGGGVLATATRSTADERAVLGAGKGVETHELRVGDEPVGRLRMRARAQAPSPALLRIVLTLVASEVERLRAPERATEAAQSEFVTAVLGRRILAPEEVLERAADLGLDLASGGAAIVVRARLAVSGEDDWRSRVLAAAERVARAAAGGALAADLEGPAAGYGQIVLLVPAAKDAALRKVAASVARELRSSLHGLIFVVGHSRVCENPADLYRAGNEALLAANIGESRPTAGPGEGAEEDPAAVVAFEDTGAYRLLLPALSDDPAELQRFYAETVEPLVDYDEQYGTDLVHTLETYLDADGNVAGTAQRLFTHRHTVRYRLERVRELCGLDVGSTDGREHLGLGLKAMRVLGIAAPRGPGRELGVRAGRVVRGPQEM